MMIIVLIVLNEHCSPKPCASRMKNSVYTDQTPRYAASDQCIHCFSSSHHILLTMRHQLHLAIMSLYSVV